MKPNIKIFLEKRIPLTIPEHEYQIIKLLLNAHAFRILGITWVKWITWRVDFLTNELVFNWE
jgi:hypothetical protein